MDNQHMKPKVCAVVSTFNRKKLLIECLEALKRQTRPVDAIFIVDGPSTDGTPEALFESGYIKELPPKDFDEIWETTNITISVKSTPIKVYYIRFKKDIGGTGNFHEGIKRALKEDCEWVWLFDDDAEPREDALEKLLQYTHLPDAVALASLKINEEGKVDATQTAYLDLNRGIRKIIVPISLDHIKSPTEIDFSAFNGFLINSKAIERVGLPMKEFFIYYDDVEYSLRLKQVGKIYLVLESIVIHKSKGAPCISKKILFISSCRIPYRILLKTFYRIRNTVFLMQKYTKNKVKLYVYLFLYLIRSTVAILIFDDFKIRRIVLLVRAIYDGIRGNFDNELPYRILKITKK